MFLAMWMTNYWCENDSHTKIHWTQFMFTIECRSRMEMKAVAIVYKSSIKYNVTDISSIFEGMESTSGTAPSNERIAFRAWCKLQWNWKELSMWSTWDTYLVAFVGILFKMNAGTSKEVLQLYRQLLRYGKELKYTNKSFFKERVRKEFEVNRNLQSEADIEFQIKVSSLVRVDLLLSLLMLLFWFVISTERASLAGTEESRLIYQRSNDSHRVS